MVLDRWEFLGQPPRRRTTGQLPPLPVQVGLIVKACSDCDIGQTGTVRCLQQSVGDLEAHHPARDLWRQAELSPKSLTQVPPAPADLPGQRGYLDPAVAGAQPPPGPSKFRRWSVTLLGDPGQHGVQLKEPVGPRACRPQPLDELTSDRPQQRAQLDDGVSQLPGGQPEQDAGTQRGEVQVDAVLAAVMADQRRGRRQTTGKRGE